MHYNWLKLQIRKIQAKNFWYLRLGDNLTIKLINHKVNWDLKNKRFYNRKIRYSNFLKWWKPKLKE